MRLLFCGDYFFVLRAAKRVRSRSEGLNATSAPFFFPSTPYKK